jgi:hypothetical protein
VNLLFAEKIHRRRTWELMQNLRVLTAATSKKVSFTYEKQNCLDSTVRACMEVHSAKIIECLNAEQNI